ncbi:DUF599 domain-containing protein [Magnetospirillum moscoviense]|uniref:DUF599 domain-containing protein n=1 Tax=Magnetospirillum moscoviense TaxID=1437059 RepID=A0A178MS54_9PROT|nr:DUF599 family protein [Magnetospirillum moscoviense]OAN50877.1 hypothetical protein A6A05_11430 [Magnetospirillum moscoviense]
MIQSIPILDLAALGVFLALWVCYTVAADHYTSKGRSLSAVMGRHRLVWMRSLCDRDNRVADTAIIGNLMRSVAFFASASLLVVGGLAALMGSGRRGYEVTLDIPFMADGGHEAFEMKVLLLACLFIYTFFQITWSLRQFNYCCILMGSAPMPEALDADKDRFACHAARLQALAANSFNRGLRAYYFALAMLGWFVNAWVFMAAAAAVTAILFRREFHSKSMKALASIVDAGGRA